MSSLPNVRLGSQFIIKNFIINIKTPFKSTGYVMFISYTDHPLAAWGSIKFLAQMPAGRAILFANFQGGQEMNICSLPEYGTCISRDFNGLFKKTIENKKQFLIACQRFH